MCLHDPKITHPYHKHFLVSFSCRLQRFLDFFSLCHSSDYFLNGNNWMENKCSIFQQNIWTNWQSSINFYVNRCKNYKICMIFDNYASPFELWKLLSWNLLIRKSFKNSYPICKTFWKIQSKKNWGPQIYTAEDYFYQKYRYMHYLYKLAVSKMAARVNVRSCWVADIVETDAWLIKYLDVSFCGEGAWNPKAGAYLTLKQDCTHQISVVHNT